MMKVKDIAKVGDIFCSAKDHAIQRFFVISLKPFQAMVLKTLCPMSFSVGQVVDHFISWYNIPEEYFLLEKKTNDEED